MHGHVAEPGEERNVPEGEFHLAGKWIAPFPDVGRGKRPKIGERIDLRVCFGHEFAQGDQPESNEDQRHPRRRDIRNERYEVVAICGNDCHQHADAQDRQHPADARRIDIFERGHGKINPHSDGGGGHGDHRTSEEAKHHPIGEVVKGHQVTPADLFELVVQREPGAGSYWRREKSPTQYGEQVAHQ